MPLSSIWALVPVKPLAQAKSRLAGVLNPQERSDLMCTLIMRTLDALQNCDALAGVLVISADAHVGILARAFGAEYLPEAPPCDLNISLTRARDAAIVRGADGALIVPADLPCIDAQSIDAVLNAAHPTSMVIVPDRHHKGTNCLFIAPPDAFELQFGAHSLSRHIAAGKAASLTITVLEQSPLALDLDIPDDLADASWCLAEFAKNDSASRD